MGIESYIDIKVCGKRGNAKIEFMEKIDRLQSPTATCVKNKDYDFIYHYFRSPTFIKKMNKFKGYRINAIWIDVFDLDDDWIECDYFTINEINDIIMNK